MSAFAMFAGSSLKIFQPLKRKVFIILFNSMQIAYLHEIIDLTI